MKICIGCLDVLDDNEVCPRCFPEGTLPKEHFVKLVLLTCPTCSQNPKDWAPVHPDDFSEALMEAMQRDDVVRAMATEQQAMQIDDVWYRAEQVFDLEPANDA
jgi:hypothetical protein